MPNYAGKSVLDLGADYGSTVVYFLAQGAKYVYAVEGRGDWFMELQTRLKGLPVSVCGLWIETAGQVAKMLEEAYPDVVKVDIEFAEMVLTDLDSRHLNIPHDWMVECHNPAVKDIISNLFTLNGFIVTEHFPQYGGRNVTLWARKNDAV